MLAGCAGMDDAPDATTTDATVLSVRELEALVRTSAGEARPVQSVLCTTSAGDLAFCAVTFRGPSCALWYVQSANATGLGRVIKLPVVKGASGSRSGKSLRCGYEH